MKENRIYIMKFRATQEEKAVIMEKVIDAGMNISEYLINQLTRAVNSGYIQAVNLHETEEVLSQLWQSLNSLRQDVR
jgi:hypothetical protein